MTSAPSLDQLDPGRPAQTSNPIWPVVRDFVGVALLAIASLAAGLVMNRLSDRPLPFVYQTTEQRFDAELTTLVTAPPFKIAPAATVGLRGIPFGGRYAKARSSLMHARQSSLNKDMCPARSISRETPSPAITGN